MKNKLYILPVIGAVAVGSVAGAIFTSATISNASAATISPTTTTSPTKVSDTAMTAAQQASREQQEITDLTTSLSQAVSSGTLTQAQSDLALKIESSRDTLHSQEETTEGTAGETSEHTNMRNLTDAQRAQLQTDQETALAKVLGISVSDLSTLNSALQNAGIRMGGHGFGRGFHN